MKFSLAAFLFDAKRFFSVAFAFLFSFLLYASPVTPGQGAGTSIHSTVRGSLYPSTIKIMQKQLLDNSKAIDIHLSKNEREACQLVLKTKNIKNNLEWDMTAFSNGNGNTLECKVFKESYINVSTTDTPLYYPDAIVPFAGGKFSVDHANVSQPFYIQVASGAQTPAGNYTATISIKDNDDGGKTECTFTITAVVWNFTLPVTPSCETAMGLEKGQIAAKHGVAGNSAEATELYKKYYEFLLSHKISAYNLPVDILSDEADAYMSDPRVTSFCIPYSGSDEQLVKYYAKVNSNPVWAAKGFFYPIDEPSTAEAYATYCQMTDRLARLCPGYHMVTPFNTYKFTSAGKDFNSVEQQKGKSDIMCCISNLYDEDGFARQVAERVANGDKSWWYVCCGPKGDYCNIFTHWEGIQHRLLFWQQKQNKVTGLLYWSTSYWADVKDVWTQALTTPWTGKESFGDGSLLYNGNKVGIDGPVSSLRLEAVTDGIDDYEYLTMAGKLFGEDYVSDTIAKVSSSMTKYTYSDKLFDSVRTQLGNDISNYYAAN